MSRKHHEDVNMPDGTYEGEGEQREEPHSKSKDGLKKYRGDFENAVAEKQRDESTLQDFMDALIENGPLEPDEIGRSEDWPGDYALAEVQETPSDRFWGWGYNGDRKYMIEEDPGSEFIIVEEMKSELGIPKGKVIDPANEYIDRR